MKKTQKPIRGQISEPRKFAEMALRVQLPYLKLTMPRSG